MTPAETLHHIRAVMAGGDAPHLALWKINRILEGREPQGLADNWTGRVRRQEMTDRNAYYCEYCRSYHPVAPMVAHYKTKEGNQ